MELSKEIEVFTEEREKEEVTADQDQQAVMPQKFINETNANSDLALVETNKELTYPKSGPERVMSK